MDIKNYTIKFIGDVYRNVTVEEAEKVLTAWHGGEKFIILNGEAFATHQIIAVHRRREGQDYSLESALEERNLIPKLKGNLELEADKRQQRKEILKQFREKLTIGNRENKKLLN